MSEQYIVSARKYRPATFRSVVGQKALTATLKNAIDSKRLAQAYLFTGPRGVGKTSCARIFAKTINCLSPTPDGEACGVCDSCRAINEGNSFNIIELDAASNNSVDDIRALTDQVNVPPQVGDYRVFIIDEVHMLSAAAFNAFLKTLEEPPKYVIFILATTEKHKVIPTILSRCQIYDFKRITIQDMVEHLKYVASQEGIEAEPEALGVIARKADGAMRDALSIFDQVAAYSQGKITYAGTIANLNVLDYDYYFRIVEAFRAGDVAESLLIYKEIRDKGFDSLFFVSGLSAHVRDLMASADARTLPLLEVAEDVAQKYAEQAKSLPLQWYYAAMKLLNDCDFRYRTASNKQFLVELTLIRLCQLLNPPTPPFDRVDAEIPLKTPSTSARPAAPSATPASPAPTASAQPAQPAPQAPAPQPAPVSHPSATQSSSSAYTCPGPQPGVQQASSRTRRPGSMSLSAMAQQAAAETARKEKRRQAVTLDAFMAAWKEYAQRDGLLNVMAVSMKKDPVTQTGPEAFKTVVDHQAIEQAFKSDSHILPFLKDKLQNDFITLEVVVNDQEIVKQMPPQELLQKIVNDNPALGRMLSTLDPEIV